MRILVVVTFGGLSFWLTPLPVLLIRSIQQPRFRIRFSGLRLSLSIPLSFLPGRVHTSSRPYRVPSLTCVSPPPAHAPYQEPGASPEHTIG